MRYFQYLTGCVLTGLISVPLYADEALLSEALEKQGSVAERSISSQKKIDKLSEQSMQLRAEIANKRRELENLEIYNRYLERSASKQDETIEDKKQQLSSIAILQRDIVPLMIRMVDALEKIVHAGNPFHVQERLQRVSDVREDIHGTDKTIAEKYRRVLELYRQEAEYGRKLEVFTAGLDAGGQKLTMEFLRIGTIALFYRSPDRQRYAQWDSKNQTWQSLESDTWFEIDKAYKVAAKRTAPALLRLPLYKGELQ